MPNLQSFFHAGAIAENSLIALDADMAKHVSQVLRMKVGERLLLTDGKGTVAEAEIKIVVKNKCSVLPRKVTFHQRGVHILHIAVAFTKNTSRNEWLLEKATELGVGSIIPLVTSRSEKTHMRQDRCKKILLSAMLQSQQYYLPEFSDELRIPDLVKKYQDTEVKLIAHCMEDNKQPLTEMLKPLRETILLIGPEGDFTQDEVNLCITNGFKPVSLGANRLRTETAAITAAAIYNVMRDEKV